MDRDIALQLGRLETAELSALLAFMQSDLSRAATSTMTELARINPSGDVKERRKPD